MANQKTIRNEAHFVEEIFGDGRVMRSLAVNGTVVLQEACTTKNMSTGVLARLSQQIAAIEKGLSAEELIKKDSNIY